MICSHLRFGRGYSTKDIRENTGLEKQRLNYWLTKLCEEGILRQQTRGIYEMTFNGKRIYDKYERLRGKQLVRIENMHVTYHVITGISKLFERLTRKRSKLNNVMIYTSRIDNHVVKWYKNKGEWRFQVYVTKVLGESPKEAYYQARLDADSVACRAQWYGVTLSEGWVSHEPEIAFPSPIASALLMTNEASQIRTNKGIMNRSKGRYADWEPRSLQQAQKIVDMPDAISRLEDRLERIEGNLKPISRNHYSDFAGSFWSSFR